MSHFSDFMDGVPVKISEKYKRPPRIQLPYSVSECTSRAQNVVENSVYCPTFETNVLSKIKELKNAKQTRKNERRHRVQLLEEAKQKKLDAIAAAEAEEKLKQLSVSDVSYPSTDEISALSPDDNPEKLNDLTPIKDAGPEIAQINNIDANIVTYNNLTEQQSNILQPIQVQNNYNQQNSLLDDPDPLQEFTRSSKVTKIHQFNHNIETLTVKDFENDTSSPFDNVELKTINDMELLAQVLQSQRDSHVSCDVPNIFNQAQTYNEMPGCVGQADNTAYLPNTYPNQQIANTVPVYPSPQHFPTSNGYYLTNEATCDNVMPMENLDMYMSNYQYYMPVNPYCPDPSYGYQQQLQSVVGQNPVIQGNSTYIPQPYYFQPPQVPTQPSTYIPTENTVTEKPLSPIQIKSRSRSVPDIVKELDEQIRIAKEERAKAVPIASPTPVTPSCSRQSKEVKLSKRKSEILPNPYDKLSQRLQGICQKIHGMGFPLDRVARVCTLVGENDKKIIEGLLIMGELMDLGFSERKVSAALAKHEFNRDKALDDLVS